MAAEGEQTGRRVALVSGASGITGSHLLRALERQGGWGIVSVARGRRDLMVAGVTQVEADLSGPSRELEAAIKGAGGRATEATHMFHCAYTDTGDAVKDCEVNAGMLQCLVEGAEAAGCKLEHVFCMEGTKWYGESFHSPLMTPFREDQPRHMPPNFYYSQQDYLESRQAGGAPWAWSALRPNPVCGFSRGSFMNLSTSLAVYASICKELGLALRFPGSLAAYNAVSEVCDAEVLADAMLWTSTQPQCANRAFNVSNGDVFRWSQVWPKLAECFVLEVAPPVPLPLSQVMADKGDVWTRLVEKHGLQDTPYGKLATWKFAEFILTQPGDWFSNVNSLRRTGFHGQCVDSDEMFVRQFQQMREQRIIP